MSTGNRSNYFVHTLLRARDWQHRPEFDQVCDWWRGRGVGFQPANRDDRKLEAYATRGRGVCALVGMGGAGKTAIADRFLNELPVGRIANPSSSSSVGRVSNPSSSSSSVEWVSNPSSSTTTSLPAPHSIFVYSFYDDDKPENFFRHLQIWLEGAETSATRIAEIWQNPLSPMQGDTTMNPVICLALSGNAVKHFEAVISGVSRFCEV